MRKDRSRAGLSIVTSWGVASESHRQLGRAERPVSMVVRSGTLRLVPGHPPHQPREGLPVRRNYALQVRQIQSPVDVDPRVHDRVEVTDLQPVLLTPLIQRQYP